METPLETACIRKYLHQLRCQVNESSPQDPFLFGYVLDAETGLTAESFCVENVLQKYVANSSTAVKRRKVR